MSPFRSCASLLSVYKVWVYCSAVSISLKIFLLALVVRSVPAAIFIAVASTPVGLSLTLCSLTQINIPYEMTHMINPSYPRLTDSPVDLFNIGLIGLVLGLALGSLVVTEYGGLSPTRRVGRHLILLETGSAISLPFLLSDGS